MVHSGRAAALGLGDLVDVNRVEVLKGPQSTLYGKNSTAGVVAVYTEAPGDKFTINSELTARYVQGASDATDLAGQGGVSGPVSDRSAWA